MRSIDSLTRLVVLTMLAAAALLMAASGVRAAEPLRWKLQAGDKFDQVMIQDMDVAMSAPGGQQMSMTMHQQMDMTWDVQKIDDDGTAVINQSIDRVQLSSVAPMGRGFEYDTQSKEPVAGQAADFAPMYEALTQGPVEITMSPRGEIANVKVPDTMIDAIKNSPNAAMMGDMATPKGLERMLTQGSMVLPEGAPTPGQKWQTSMEMNTPMTGKMTVDTSYEYTGTKDVDGATCAVIQPTVTTKFGGGAAMQMTVKNESSSGEILFNVDQGRLQSSTIKQSVTLDIAMGDQSIQQTIGQTTKVTLTPVAE